VHPFESSVGGGAMHPHLALLHLTAYKIAKHIRYASEYT